MARYFSGISQEEFPPEELLRQAVAAQDAGFDGISSSDHLQPWWEKGQSGHTWPWLGAAGQATSTIPLGTGVTSTGARYHPALIAQAWILIGGVERAGLPRTHLDRPDGEAAGAGAGGGRRVHDGVRARARVRGPTDRLS